MSSMNCPLYPSDAADEMQCVDLGGRRFIKKKIFLISFYRFSLLSLPYDQFSPN